MLLVPERATDMHLQILSELAQMFSDKAFRSQLAAALTPRQPAPDRRMARTRLQHVNCDHLGRVVAVHGLD